jgi:hypothetical protein
MPTTLSQPLHDLYSLLNVIRIIRSRRLIRAGNVALLVEKRGGVGESEENRPLA